MNEPEHPSRTELVRDAEELPPIEPVRPVELPPLKPGTGWYWFAGVTAVLSLVVGGFVFFSSVFSVARQITSGEEIRAGQTREIRLEPGRYDVYWFTEGESPRSPPVVSVVGPEGEEIRLQSVPGSVTLNLDGERGERILRFDVRRQGIHTVSVEAPPAAGRDSRVLVSRRASLGQLAGVVLGPAIALVGLGVAVVVTVVVASRRKRARRLRNRVSDP